MSHLPEFTRRVVDWTPWIETIDDIDAAPDQLAIVDEIVGGRKTGRTYWAALAHDADVLRHRHDLFPETLRDKADEGGSPRADLELSAVAGSRVTGCVYCASVHARAYVQLAQNAELIDAVLADGGAAAIPDREHALVAFSAKLSEAPHDITASDLTPMRDAGFSDLEIYDIAHASAMFAWANRLLLTLGGQTVDREAAAE
jgi:uncharacterized peroxidase-related enzyme